MKVPSSCTSLTLCDRHTPPLHIHHLFAIFHVPSNWYPCSNFLSKLANLEFLGVPTFLGRLPVLFQHQIMVGTLTTTTARCKWCLVRIRSELGKNASKQEGLGSPRIPQHKTNSTHFCGKSSHLLSKAKLYKQSTKMGPHRISLKEATMAKHRTWKGIAYPFLS